MSTLGRTDGIRRLSQLLRLRGTRTVPSDIDIATPVVTTYDISRDALESGILTVQMGHTLVTPGTGAFAFTTVTAETMIDGVQIQQAMRNLGLNNDDASIWLVDVNATVSAASIANFNSVDMGIQPTANTKNIVFDNGAINRWLFSANTSGPQLTSGGVHQLRLALGAGVEFPTHRVPNPLPARMGEIVIRANDTGVGTCSILFSETIVVGPRHWRPFS